MLIYRQDFFFSILIKIKHKDLDARLLEPLKNLEQSLIQQRQAQISWPHEEPFNEIENKKNIDSILLKIKIKIMKKMNLRHRKIE